MFGGASFLVIMNNSVLSRLKKRPVKTILVIRFRFMGDMVVMTPLFSNLRRHFPEARIVAFVDDVYADVLRYHPDVDEVMTFPRRETRTKNLRVRRKAWVEMIKKLRESHFDLVIDLAKGRTSSFFTRVTNAPVRIGYIPKEGAQWNTRFYTYPMRDGEMDGMHCVDHYLQPLVDVLELPVLTRDLVLPPRDEEKQRVSELMQQNGLQPQKFILLHPGARAPRKRWPVEHWAKLADELTARYGFPLVVIGAEGERDISERVLELASPSIVNFVGQLSVGELAALAAQARLFIGNDSGPMHVVSTTGTDIVCLFGPTDDRVWQPSSPNHRVLRRPCPCTLAGPETPCDIEGARCLRGIPPEEVLQAAASFLGDIEQNTAQPKIA